MKSKYVKKMMALALACTLACSNTTWATEIPAEESTVENLDDQPMEDPVDEQEEMPEDIQEEMPEETQEEMPEETQEEMPEEMPEETPKESETASVEEPKEEPKAAPASKTARASKAAGRTMRLDGDLTDWTDISKNHVQGQVITEWAMAQNSDYYYIYAIQDQAQENRWYEPIQNAMFSFQADNGTTYQINVALSDDNKKATLRCNWQDMPGGEAVFALNETVSSYVVEYAVPKAYFANQNTSVGQAGFGSDMQDVSLLPDLADYDEVKEEVPTYDGIVIDGSFADWKAVGMSAVEDGWLDKIAVIFEKDYLYIYLKESGADTATSAGPYSNGNYEILTDLGRRTTFRLRRNRIEGIDGAKVAYSSGLYEIAIPASAIKYYRESISLGYAQTDRSLVEGITPFEGRFGSNLDQTFNGITIDGTFGDWQDYKHSIIEYSSAGSTFADGDMALTSSNAMIYGHAQTYEYGTEKNPFDVFDIYFNQDQSLALSFKMFTVGDGGEIIWLNGVNEIPSGKSTHVYIVDKGHGLDNTVRNYNDILAFEQKMMDVVMVKDTNFNSDIAKEFIKEGGKHYRGFASILGEGYVYRDAEDYAQTQFEWVLDMKKISAFKRFQQGYGIKDGFDLLPEDMKEISCGYINIGPQHISTAGTSSGPVAGVILCVGFVGCILAYRKKKYGVVTTA